MEQHIVVIGSINMDLVVRAPNKPSKGQTVLGSQFAQYPGGKGANQAVQIARLGAKVYMVGRVGNDSFGRDLLDNLKQAGVLVDYVCRDEQAGAGLACIFTNAAGDNWIVVVPQANMHCTKEDIEKAKSVIVTSSILVAQLEIPLSVVAYAIDMASDHRIPVLLNPAPAQEIPRAVLKKVNILVPNETEAEALTGTRITDLESAKIAARILLEMGPEKVIITMGEKGSLLATHDEMMLVPSWKVDAIDTTAAGDAFCGALAVALAESRPLKSAIRFANAAGALSVTRAGAQPSLPTRAEIETLLSKTSADTRI